MKSNYYLLSSMSIGFIARVLDAVVKFVSIPLLIQYLGVESFGLFTLVFSLNAYAQILNLGVNTGAVKFYSEYIKSGDDTALFSSIRVGLGFYLSIAVFNAIIYLVLYTNPDSLGVTQNEVELFKTMLLVSCITLFIGWVNNTFEQVVVANKRITFIHFGSILRSFMYLGTVYLVIKFSFSVVWVFVALNIISFIQFPLNVIYVKYLGLIDVMLPSFEFSKHKAMFKYSMGIFAMGVFQSSAVYAKPIVLKAFGQETGNILLTEYRILEVYPLFVTSIVGISIATLLPVMSSMNISKTREQIWSFILDSTGKATFLAFLVIMPIAMSSKIILKLYVGENYLYLSHWLEFWLLTTLLFIHNVPFATYVLASGKTKLLVLSSALAMLTSIFVNIFLIDDFGVGSSVFAQWIYLTIQMVFYYTLIVKSYNFSGGKLLMQFVKYGVFAFPIYLVVRYYIQLLQDDSFISISAAVLIWCTAYLGLSRLFGFMPKLK